MIMPDKQTIDNFARESFLRLTNGRENADKELFYRHGFAEGFKKCAEMARQFARFKKTPVKVHVDIDNMRAFDELCKADDFRDVFADSAFKLAQGIERKMFEVMIESKSSKVFVVDLGPQYNGSSAEWRAEITCDEERAKFLSKLCECHYIRHDFKYLLKKPEDEFMRLLMEAHSRGDENRDVVLKWRDEMKKKK